MSLKQTGTELVKKKGCGVGGCKSKDLGFRYFRGRLFVGFKEVLVNYWVTQKEKEGSFPGCVLFGSGTADSDWEYFWLVEGALWESLQSGHHVCHGVGRIWALRGKQMD